MVPNIESNGWFIILVIPSFKLNEFNTFINFNHAIELLIDELINPNILENYNWD